MSLSVALIGFGLAGRHLHAPIIRAAGMDIKAVVSSRKNEILEDHPSAEQHDSFDSVLSRDDIDLVVLTTPNELHYPQALAALENGKHVVTDKPFTIESKQAEHLIEVARREKLKLSVYHNRRWDTDFLTLQELVNKSALGQVTSATLRWDRWRPDVTDKWRDQDIPGAGLLYDLGPHLIDQAVLLFGKPDWLIADVYAQRLGAKSDDSFQILMAKDQRRITLGVNYMTADGLPRYIVNGTLGTFRKSWLDPQESQLTGGMLPSHDAFGVEAPERWGVLYYPDGRQHTVPSTRGDWSQFYRGMCDAIVHDTAEPVDPCSALYNMYIIEAAFASSREGRRVDLSAQNQRLDDLMQ